MNTLTPPATGPFEQTLRARLPKAAFRPLTAGYLEEPRGLFKGQGGLLVAPPRTVDEVATVIRACAEARVGVVPPFGGGTGLVGGQVQPDGPAPVILSTERLTAIRAVHPSENVLVAEAGAILADVQQAAEATDRLFPLSLASEGSCRIGGTLATNAGGGVNVLRYGTARELCLGGLEAVLPDGSVWHGLKRLRKDNTGYDLRDLLCGGAEGTLGVITAAPCGCSHGPRRLAPPFWLSQPPPLRRWTFWRWRAAGWVGGAFRPSNSSLAPAWASLRKPTAPPPARPSTRCPTGRC